jgi:predicted MFS family arabinose efflux permease
VMVGVYTIVEAGVYGWGSAHTLGFGAGAVALLAGFVVRESIAREPLIPLRVFRSRNVAGANVVQLLMVSSLFGMFFLGVLFMQEVLGYSAIGTGFAFLPVSVGIGVMSLGFSARLNFRFGPKAVLLTGLGLFVVALGWLTRAPIHSSYVVDLLPSMVLLGIGAGMSFPALMSLAMSGATPGDAGLASGLVNTTQQVGGALGLAVLATLSSTHTAGLVADGVARDSALTSGYHLAWVVSAGIAAVSVALASSWIRSVRLGQDTATSLIEEEGELFNPIDPVYLEAA